VNALLLLFALSGTPDVEAASAIDAHNEQMLQSNGFVVRAVMVLDSLGFIIFIGTLWKSANRTRINEERSRINEERMLLLGAKIDQCLTILRAESTVQCHVLDQAKNLAQGNSIKLDEVKQQIDATAASIIMESKSTSDSAHAMAAVNAAPVVVVVQPSSEPRGLYSYRSPEP